MLEDEPKRVAQHCSFTQMPHIDTAPQTEVTSLQGPTLFA
jgi:hypothetical protein